MTNSIAFCLGFLIIGFFVLDHYLLHYDALAVVLQLLIEMIGKVAFWR